MLPALPDSGLVCPALAQSLLGFTSETHWPRYAGKHLTGIVTITARRGCCSRRQGGCGVR